jgi:hypothetical protein
MYNVQDYSVLYINVVRPVICDGWHFMESACMTTSFHGEWRFGPIQLVGTTLIEKFKRR